jgi:DmsE family decaheme c-type cytochrome
MRRWITCQRLLLFILLNLLVGVSLARSVGRPPGQDDTSKPAVQNQPEAGKNDYVTSATCAACHEDVFNSFTKNPHQILEISSSKGWRNLSCESCHGPGDTHVNAGDGTQIFPFKGLSAKEANGKCLSCHARAESHAGGGNSLHGKNQIACTDCHNIHAPKESLHLLADKSNILCSNCHKEIQAAFLKPYRHRLNEGAISCVDCHQPHGGLQPRQLKVSFGNEVTCVKCHTDKRGPFAFEHAAMRLEGCMGCHEPHGSVNPKMLIRHEQRFLCLECHSASSDILGAQPPSFHDLRSPRFQNCSTCHLRVHGSNVNRFLLR